MNLETPGGKECNVPFLETPGSLVCDICNKNVVNKYHLSQHFKDAHHPCHEIFVFQFEKTVTANEKESEASKCACDK